MSREHQVKFEDILEGLTVHEEVDEVTGLSRYIIVDSPDEKKQPAIISDRGVSPRVRRRRSRRCIPSTAVV
ncbi:MAG: hypothetical protein U0Q11_25120 [Vicinamibacterales bacterium]